jgi:mRNA interferase RelE/StbE
MAYSLNFTRQAFKDLERINEPFYSSIKVAIVGLTQEPLPHGLKAAGLERSRIRVGNYRNS